ncbi:hypothetical protein HK100_004681 [Physocladia obscura]|uniref:F-box domain-containing protein n=1 Tax=Physocladia obscura TaxID=109957 RepID=A0AAD5T6Y0_9FUNG|nr:hypothetical protein HK100_004681 [Physocladia obscura]
MSTGSRSYLEALHDDHIASCGQCLRGGREEKGFESEAVDAAAAAFAAMTPATQGAVVAALVKLMRPSQLRCLAATVARITRVDFISSLSPELSLRVLQYLDAKSLCRAAQVAHTWGRLADDDLIWHRMCEQHIDKKCKTCGWGLPIIRNSGRRASPVPPPQQLAIPPSSTETSTTTSTAGTKRKRLDSDPTDNSSSSANQVSPSQLPSPVQSQSSTTIPKRRLWKNIYAERLIVERNWRKPQFRASRFIGHTDGIMSMQFNDCKQRFVTGGHDNIIRVWDAETNKCIKELTGHTQGVSGVQFDDQIIISCSLDRTVRIWSMKTFEMIRTFDNFRDGVVCLHFVDELLATGCADATIRIINLHTGKFFHLRGHTDWVNKVQIYKKEYLFSCSDDRSVRMWDIATKTVVREFVGHHDQVQSLSISLPVPRSARASIESLGGSPKLVTGSTDKFVKVWDIETGKCLHTLYGHEDGVMCVASDTLRVVSGSHDDTVIVWDLESGKRIHSMEMAGQSRGNTVDGGATGGVINCVQLSDTKVLTGGEDGVISVYDFYPDDLFE